MFIELFHSGRIRGEAEIPMNPKDKSEFKFLHGSVTGIQGYGACAEMIINCTKYGHSFSRFIRITVEVPTLHPSQGKSSYAHILAMVLLNR